MPDNLYANADVKRNGEPITNLCENMYKNKCVSLKKPENIAGNTPFNVLNGQAFAQKSRLELICYFSNVD